MLVVDKPAGMVVHPGAGRSGGTLAAAILAHAPTTAGVGGPRRPGIVHRLDKDTSGLLVVAKTPHAYDDLVEQLAARTVTRRYLAVVHGRVRANESVVDAPIGRHPSNRVKMAIRPAGRGKRAVTRYRVLERFAHFTVLEVRLETGRTHQIRVHLLRRVVVIAWLLSALLAAPNAGQASGTERDSVVSYFRERVSRGPGNSSWISSSEWHVYDPVRRADRLLLTLPGRVQVVQWDTTFTSVCFIRSLGFTMRDSIYRCDWRFGARPRLVAVVPPPNGMTNFWFNPDSARWQASQQWPVGGDTLWRRELLQADRQGREWRRLLGDSVIVDPDDGPVEWAVATAMRREPGVSEPGAREDLDRIETEAVWFDTSTVHLYPGTSRESDDASWHFLPFRTAPGMGLAFRWETFVIDGPVMGAPIFVVDLGRHTKRLLSSENAESWCGPVHFGAERRGYALASFCFDGPRIIEVRTGEIVFDGGPDTREPTWVLAPLH